MTLASTIIKMEIPSRIEKLTAREYISLRRRYQDVREPFQHAVRQICDDRQLGELRDRKQFQEAVEAAALNFCNETKKLRKQQWASRVTNWSVVGLGALSSFCSLGAGAAVFVGAGISVILHVYQGLRGSPYITEKREAQQLLGDMKGEILRPRLLRRLALR